MEKHPPDLLLALSGRLTPVMQVNFTPHTHQKQNMLQRDWPQHEPKPRQIPDQTRVRFHSD